MSFQIAREHTEGQMRRRAAYRQRRSAKRGVFVAVHRVKRPRLTFKALRTFRATNLDKAAKFIATVQQRFAEWRQRTAPRCRYVRVYMERGVQVIGDPCGGKLHAYRPNPKAETVLRCHACGRSWRNVEGQMVTA